MDFSKTSIVKRVLIEGSLIDFGGSNLYHPLQKSDELFVSRKSRVNLSF